MKELWLQFNDVNEYSEKKEYVESVLSEAAEGDYTILIYLKTEKYVKRLTNIEYVNVTDKMIYLLEKEIGRMNVKIVFKEAPAKEPLERIADVLESINEELSSINSFLLDMSDHTANLEKLGECFNAHNQLCITGDVTAYTR